MEQPETQKKNDLLSPEKKEKALSLGEISPENTSETETSFSPYFEKLTAERTRLDAALAEYDFRDFQTILNPEDVNNAQFEKISTTWLERVRATTDYLKPLDSLGIRIFNEHLECQPAFPNHTITFSSKEVAAIALLEASHIEGLAKVLAPTIEIKAAKPVLREQLFYLASRGHVGSACEMLIHELVHRHHKKQRRTMHGILTESQAYFSGIYGNPKNFSIKNIAEELTRKSDGKEAALYEFDTQATERVLEQVAALYGTGLSYAEVSDILTASDYVPEEGCFQPLTDKVEEIKKIKGYSDADLQQLHSMYQQHAYNENQKARLALYETIQESIPLDELRRMRQEKLRGRILHPTFFKDGKPFVFPVQFRQKVILPMNSKYPYEPGVVNTGIAFGLFEQEAGQEPVFKIGRWEAQRQSSEMKFLDSPDLSADEIHDKEMDMVEDLRNEADRLSLKDKKELADVYANKKLYENPLVRSIVRALISGEEWKNIITESLPNFIEKVQLLRGVFEGITFTGQKLHPEDKRKLESYRHTVDSIQAVFDYSGQKPEDFDPTFAEHFRSLEFTLSQVLGRT